MNAVSCVFFPPEFFQDKEIEPDNIDIPGYGLCKYIKTLYLHDNIVNIALDDCFIWLLDTSNNCLRKHNIYTESDRSIDLSNYIGYEIAASVVNDRILVTPDNIVLIIKTDIYNSSIVNYYTLIINKTTYDEETKKIDRKEFIYSVNNIGLELYLDFTDGLFHSQDLGTTWNLMQDDEYSLIFQTPASIPQLFDPRGFFSDSKVMYILDDEDLYTAATKLFISVDNGENWFTGILGTNIGENVVSWNDSVFISARRFTPLFQITPEKILGGGLLLYKWQYY
jgi:hypothetical protein